MATPQTPVEHISLAGLRILIVDDVLDESEIFSHLLERTGAIVETASSVAEAMESFEAEPPNVVIGDINLIDREGDEFVRTLQSLPAESGDRVMAIALTDEQRDAGRDPSLKIGFDYHLSRPVEFATLLQTLASIAEGISETRQVREAATNHIREQRVLRERVTARQDGVAEAMAHLQQVSSRQAVLKAQNAAALSNASAAIARNRQVMTPDRLASNFILASLPPGELRAVASLFEPALLTAGEILHEPGEDVRYAFFPISSVLAKQCVFASGKAVEVAQLGRDGMTGMGMFVGFPETNFHTRVQVGGEVARLGSDALGAALEAAPTLPALVLRHTYMNRAEIAQTAACNSMHYLSNQLPKWLLSLCDKLGSDSLRLTHESIASSLGTRRASITVALGELQADGLIRCGRGRVEIVDRRGLERAACECYAVTKAMHANSFV